MAVARKTPPRNGGVPPERAEDAAARESARERELRAYVRMAESRAANRRFQYMTVIWTAGLLGILLLMSYKVYTDARMDIEEQFNRQQLLLADQAAGRMASFLDELMASLRYSARFLHTVRPEHPGRMSAMAGLYERLGGRLRVSEVGYIRTADATGAPPSGEYAGVISRCAERGSSCLLIARKSTGMPAFLFGAAQVSRGEWIFAKVTLEDLDRSFVSPVYSGLKGRAWLLDEKGRVLISPAHPEIVGRRLGDLAERAKSPRLAEMARRMLAGKRGYGSHTELLPKAAPSRHRYLTAYTPIKVGERQWTLALTAPSSEVVSLVRETFRKGFLLTGFGFIVVISAALLILDRERRRIRAEDHLHWSGQVLESKERLQALFDGITDGICILDRSLRILMLNQAMARLLGHSVGELLGLPWSGEEDSTLPAQLADPGVIRRAFESGRRGFAERPAVTLEGGKVDLEFYTYPILDAAGETTQVVLYLKDVTDRRALQRQLQQRDRLSIVGKMSAQVAHEIRNPLSAINLNAELLGDELSRFGEEETAEAWTLLRSIRTEVDILRQVTEDYLKFVRMPRSERAPGDLNGVIAELLDFLTEQAMSRGIRVERDLSPVLPEVALDESQMRVALQNLVLNAFDAMPKGGRVLVRTRLAKGRVHVEVADEGGGIRAQDQPSLFTPFFTTKANGTGLGLVLTQQIVTEHGGTIHFSSHEGEGTTFHIDLPAAAPMETEA